MVTGSILPGVFSAVVACVVPEAHLSVLCNVGPLSVWCAGRLQQCETIVPRLGIYYVMFNHTLQ